MVNNKYFEAIFQHVKYTLPIYNGSETNGCRRNGKEGIS
jgi:hypothetical protein